MPMYITKYKRICLFVADLIIDFLFRLIDDNIYVRLKETVRRSLKCSKFRPK